MPQLGFPKPLLLAGLSPAPLNLSPDLLICPTHPLHPRCDQCRVLVTPHGETEPHSHSQQAVPPGKGCAAVCQHLGTVTRGSVTSWLQLRQEGESHQSHAIPDPSSAEIRPQEDVDGQQEDGISIAHSPPQGLFLDAGECLLQGSSLLLGQGGRGAGGQTTEPQIHHFPAGRLGCCERGTKHGY